MAGQPISQDKREATAQARAALIAAFVHRSDSDGGEVRYLVTRWGVTRDFDSLEQVEALLDIFGAPNVKGSAS